MPSQPSLRPILATFVDRATELEFQRESYEQSTRSFLQFSVALGSVAFLAYGIHDRIVLPSFYEAAWRIRYGVFLPVAALVFAAVRNGKDLGRWREPLMLLFGASTTGVVIWIGALVPGEAGILYKSYAPMFVVMGPFLLRMSVATEVVFTLVTILFYLVFDTIAGSADATLRLSMCTTIAALGAIGALVANQQSRQARHSFLQQRTIEHQMDALDIEKQRSEH